MFQTEGQIDLSATENYYQISFDYMNIHDYLQPDVLQTRWSNLQLFEAKFYDDIYSPFEETTDDREYIKVVKSRADTFDRDFGYEHFFQIDPLMRDMSRVRLSFWQALGDVGGFHDGLILLVTGLIRPLAAARFQNDLLKSTLVEPSKS